MGDQPKPRAAHDLTPEPHGRCLPCSVGGWLLIALLIAAIAWLW